MNKKVLSAYEQLAGRLGLRLDTANAVLYGKKRDYDLVMFAPDPGRLPYQFCVKLSAKRSGTALSKEECKQFVRENKPVLSLTQEGTAIAMSIVNTTAPAKMQENAEAALNALVLFLNANGFQNCCQVCSKILETEGYLIASDYMELCPDCFAEISQRAVINKQQRENKKENIIGGIVGALLGTLIGVASIILLSQLGYVAALSGILMAVCTLKGYELLGRKLTVKGIIISIVLMTVMTYAGDRIDWSILVAREFGEDLFSSYRAIPYLIEQEVISSSDYIANLFQVYLFLLLGAVPTVINIFKNQKHASRVGKIGA